MSDILRHEFERGQYEGALTVVRCLRKAIEDLQAKDCGLRNPYTQVVIVAMTDFATSVEASVFDSRHQVPMRETAH